MARRIYATDFFSKELIGPSHFSSSAIDILGTLVVALGGGVCAWGGINLLEGYGNDNPGAKSQGVKQLMAGAGIAIIGLVLIPQLATLITV